MHHGRNNSFPCSSKKACADRRNQSGELLYLSVYLNAMGNLRRLGVSFLGNSIPPILTLYIGVLHSKFIFAGLFSTLDRFIESFFRTKILSFSSVFSYGVGDLHCIIIFLGIFGTLDTFFRNKRPSVFLLFSHMGL